MKTKLYKTPSPYFILLASTVTTMEFKAIEFHRINALPAHDHNLFFNAGLMVQGRVRFPAMITLFNWGILLYELTPLPGSGVGPTTRPT